MHFFLFDGTHLTQTADDANAANASSNDVYMLMLPTGQVLVDDRLGTSSSLELYSDGGTPSSAWAPQVTLVPNDLTAGDTYTVSGTQLNGGSDGAAFGDDWQMSTDYPLVQITHDASGTVTYARTFGMTNRSIAPDAASSTQFTLPSCPPQGASQLRVVADGIASAPVAVTVGGTGCLPPKCVVPDVRGKTLKPAKAAIKAHNCTLGTVKQAASRTIKKGRVISQKPKRGSRLQHGARVSLVISKGKR